MKQSWPVDRVYLHVVVGCYDFDVRFHSQDPADYNVHSYLASSSVRLCFHSCFVVPARLFIWSLHESTARRFRSDMFLQRTTRSQYTVGGTPRIRRFEALELSFSTRLIFCGLQNGGSTFRPSRGKWRGGHGFVSLISLARSTGGVLPVYAGKYGLRPGVMFTTFDLSLFLRPPDKLCDWKRCMKWSHMSPLSR